MKPTAPDAMTVGVLATGPARGYLFLVRCRSYNEGCGYFSAPIAGWALLLRSDLILRELFADVPVDLVCDRVRVERQLFRNPAGTVSPRRNRCRNCRARRSFRLSFHHRLMPEGCGKIKNRRP
jgi:hypothetical protein